LVIHKFLLPMKAFYLDNPMEIVSLEDLHELGLLFFCLDPINYKKEGKLDEICKQRGYTYADFVNSQKIPNLSEKLATFFEEHIHDDEEIRFFVDGSGFFDVRDGRSFKEDRWIRMECNAGDLIILPAGIYHRFNVDEKAFFHVMRLFCGNPVWTPWNRANSPTDSRDSRRKYLSSLQHSNS